MHFYQYHEGMKDNHPLVERVSHESIYLIKSHSIYPIKSHSIYLIKKSNLFLHLTQTKICFLHLISRHNGDLNSLAFVRSPKSKPVS